MPKRPRKKIHKTAQTRAAAFQKAKRIQVGLELTDRQLALLQELAQDVRNASGNRIKMSFPKKERSSVEVEKIYKKKMLRVLLRKNKSLSYEETEQFRIRLFKILGWNM